MCLLLCGGHIYDVRNQLENAAVRVAKEILK